MNSAETTMDFKSDVCRAVHGTVPPLVRPVCFSSQTEEWATPPDFFTRMAEQYGPFDLDVSATPENAKCARFFTRTDDGLAQPWAPERCWMNPPYGRDMGKWVRKAYEESRRGALVVCLVPARTDVAWWHDWAMHKAEITLLRGRMKFHTWRGELLDNPCKSVREGRHAPTNHAPFATAVLVYRPNAPAEARAARRLGPDVGLDYRYCDCGRHCGHKPGALQCVICDAAEANAAGQTPAAQEKHHE